MINPIFTSNKITNVIDNVLNSSLSDIIGTDFVSDSPSVNITENEKNHNNYLKAAKLGCWISLDGLGWELENHIEKIVFAKTNGFLDRILISHDAGGYDPNKELQSITPYTAIFKKLYPALKLRGFTDDELNMLISKNPSEAFAIKIRNQVLE